MDNVKKVTPPATTKNDLKSSDYVKKEEKKDNNNGKKFREVFNKVHGERTKKDGDWFEDNYNSESNNSDTEKNSIDEYTDSNKSISMAARQALRNRIKVNTEIKILQKAKSESSSDLNRDTGKTR